MGLVDVAKKKLLRSNSQVLGRLGLGLFRQLDSRGIEIPGVARLILDGIQPVDPLRKASSLPSIEIVVPFVLKDLEIVEDCVTHAIEATSNPVRAVRVITPYRTRDSDPSALQDVIHRLEQKFSSDATEFLVEYDEEILHKSILEKINQYGLSARYKGWLTAQLVKVSAALTSETGATLIVDSDTLLTYKRTWIDLSGKQILMIGQESREAFWVFATHFLGIGSRPRLSYITHHQLMQKDILEQIFPRGPESLVAWIEAASPRDSDYVAGGLAIAEYEVYGAYLDNVRPERRVFATWGNGTGRRNAGIGSVAVPQSWALSTSFHHYKSRNNTPDELL